MTARALLIPIVLSLIGCWSSSDEVAPDPEPKEISTDGKKKTEDSSGQQLAGTEDELLTIAKEMFESEMYQIAKDNFFTLRDSFPFGAYSLYAELKAADCAFFLREFPEAAKLYEEFAKNHPSSSDAPYAILQAARSYLKSNKGVGRNKAPLERALTLLKAAAEAETPYKEALLTERANVAEILAQHEQEIADFYQRRSNTEASTNRSKRRKELFEPFINSRSESLAAAAPMSPLEVTLPVSVPQERATTTERLAPSFKSSERAAVVALDCQPGPPGWVSLELSGIPDQASYLDGLEVESIDGTVQIEIPGIQSDEIRRSCFGTEDVRIDQLGRLTIRTEALAYVGIVNQPPRLLIVLE